MICIGTQRQLGEAMLDPVHTGSTDGGTARRTKQDDAHTDSESYLTLKSGDGVGGPGVRGHSCPAVGCEPQYTCAVRTHTSATSTGNPCLQIDRTQEPFVCLLLQLLHFINWVEALINMIT